MCTGGFTEAPGGCAADAAVAVAADAEGAAASGVDDAAVAGAAVAGAAVAGAAVAGAAVAGAAVGATAGAASAAIAAAHRPKAALQSWQHSAWRLDAAAAAAAAAVAAAVAAAAEPSAAACGMRSSFAASPPRPWSRQSGIGVDRDTEIATGSDGRRWSGDHALNPILLASAHATLCSRPRRQKERGEARRGEAREIAFWKDWKRKCPPRLSTLDHHLIRIRIRILIIIIIILILILITLLPTLSSTTSHPPSPSIHDLPCTHHPPPPLKSAWTTGPPTVSMTAPHPRRLQTITHHAPPADEYKHNLDDSYDRSRKRGRSPSPPYYRDDRRASAYNDYHPSADPWDRTRDSRDYRDPEPYAPRPSAAAAAAYDHYRSADPYDDRADRSRAAEWDRYYRERDHRDHDHRPTYDDRERYEARSRYDDAPPATSADRDDPSAHPRARTQLSSYDAHHRRDDHAPHSDLASSAPIPCSPDTLLPFRQYAQMILLQGRLQQKGHRNLLPAAQARSLVHGEVLAPRPWLSARIERKKAARTGKKQAWLNELQQGKLDKLNYDIIGTDDDSASRRDDSYDGGDHHDSRGRAEPSDVTLLSRHGEPETLHAEQAIIPACSHQILVKTYPADVPREKLEEVLRTKPGFRYLALGEPHVGKRWHRVGWAMYEPDIDMDDTLNALQGKDVDGFALNLAPCPSPPRASCAPCPEYANSFHRLLTDLRQCRQLVERFESEDRQVLFRDLLESDASAASWLETNASDAILERIKHTDPELVDDDLERGYDADEDATKREERRRLLKRQLDLHLDLLRTVYFCDYYISLCCEFEEELLRRSPRHARKQPPSGQLVEEAREGANDESWARSVDQKTLLLLADERTDLTEAGGKSVDAELMAAALAYVKEEDKEKHRCTVDAGAGQCGKLFKAAIFVQKHILNKHRAFIEAQAQTTLEEVHFFNNYVRDPCRATTQLGVARGDGAPLAQRIDSSNGMYSSGGRMGMIRFGNASAADSPRRQPGAGAPALGMRLGGVVTPDVGTPIKGGTSAPGTQAARSTCTACGAKSYRTSMVLPRAMWISPTSRNAPCTMPNLSQIHARRQSRRPDLDATSDEWANKTSGGCPSFRRGRLGSRLPRRSACCRAAAC
ncbi:hypothetical protein L1887_51419 [Cichorium endivia]|nr:hypothetical protein L1887_51419 [Cichorium endivia]